ncbi:hypothetical protein sphantq_04710 (plasmid) [Sphingobium sp. AntQ-1]|nr:hypothetical protein sphantq_04710 [Sphingobium sp. AntQ-1]
MRLGNALFALCIAALSLGVNGNEVDYIYIAISLFSALLFIICIVFTRSSKKNYVYSGFQLYISLAFVFYASISSLISYSFSNSFGPVISTASFLLLPISYAFLRNINISREDWILLDVDSICVNASLLFCFALILGHPSEFINSITGNSRFTWTEFRSVNPLPTFAAMLLIWRYGLRSITQWKLWALVIYIYSTKYTNWLALLAIALPLRYFLTTYSRVWASAVLVSLIVIINSIVAMNWREVYLFFPKEFERIYEIYIAHLSLIDNPIFGIGFGSSYDRGFYQAYTIHNLMAYVISSGGLLGLSIFLILIISYSRIYSGKSDYIMVSYLILTVTAASYKLPAFQLYLGLAFAGMAVVNRCGDNGVTAPLINDPLRPK